MAQEFDLSTAKWIGCSGLSDPNGPTAVPFIPYDRDWLERPVIDVVGDVACRFPARIAIDDGVMRLSYAQFYAMACRLSHAIKNADLPPGPIGIKMSDDALQQVAILGCLAAGRPFMVMSKGDPLDYTQRLVSAASLQAILVNAADVQAGLLPNGPALIPIEQALMTGIGHDDRPAGLLGPDEPAFIISTSGSTGVPKLIVSSQRRLQQEVCKYVDHGHFSENDRFLNFGSPTSIIILVHNWLPLLIGGRLHIADISRVGLSGGLRNLRDSNISILRTTVSLMKAVSQLDDARDHLASLRVVWVGGEMLLQKDLDQIRALLPQGCRLVYTLGSTETLLVSRWFVPDRDDHDQIHVANGYLDPETEVLFLDDDGQPCRDGEIGELIVRSSNVALGEWIDGKVVADRFQTDPTDLTKRIYRTGDLVRMCPDGVIVMHGRKDRMIKIRGHRVEPSLIETAIRNVSGVADAAVAAKQNDGDVRIYGFVMPSSQASGDLIPDVEDALKTALPLYMRPSKILIVKSIPRNTNGKADVNALLNLVQVDDTAEGLVKPASVSTLSRRSASDRARKVVADSWRSAFGTRDRNLTVNFEVAGGDSLQFMKIIFRMEQLTGVSLPLDAFDISMTQEDMACRLDLILGGGIKPHSQGKQVFLLPGLGGDEPRLLQFRIGCAPDLSIVGLDYGEWTQWVEPGFNYHSIVDRLAARIHEKAPTGPLTLIGYSFGGWVALDVAAKLSSLGREIERLLILDTKAIVPHGGEKSTGTVQEAPLPTLREEFGKWRKAHSRGQGMFAVGNFVARRLVRPRWASLMRWLASHRRTVLPGKIDFYLSFCFHEHYLGRAYNWNPSVQEIQRLPVPITLFRASEQIQVHQLGETSNQDNGWNQHSSDVTVVTVSGNHYTMLEQPHLTNLCDHVKATCAARLQTLAAS